MSDPRYFGIALTLDELHKILGLPEDVKIRSAMPGTDECGDRQVYFDLCGPSDRYDGSDRPWCYKSVFRPDIQTREVSQVVIHALKER